MLYIDGRWLAGEAGTSDVLDKYRGGVIAQLHLASRAQVGQATRAVAAAQAAEQLPAAQRSVVLERAADLLDERAKLFTDTIVAEGGFAVSDSAREVGRAAQTLRWCAEEANRTHGDMVPLQSSPQAAQRLAFTVRYPIGVVAAITPFNSPLNTVLHKVGPAIAAGNGVVLKPSTYTPMTAELIVGLLLDAGLPPGYISLIHGPGDGAAQWLLEDPVPGFYAFTGSTAVGEHIHRTVGLRKSQLEMGSLSSVIICADADIDDCFNRCLDAAFRKAGQICTSIQRLYVHSSIAGEFAERLETALASRVAGDPTDPNTFVGPLISRDNAERVESWINRAADQGAKVVTGGHRAGNVVEPTVLTNVDASMEVMCREVFGPVVSIRPFDSLDAAIDEANDTQFGLAAGIFTADLNNAFSAAQRLRMGSVHINETSNGRLDNMPYTGVKASGMGKEGPRYAIDEMTEERLITVRWQ
ncbi:MAG: hypothetical protein QOI26_147 [Pseudonocardiales bacterium]|jgi:succinate-semialdehyde dehydrogenase/glutarate-semialdehyde dehydrogenase|nr:hypothetical protein [Pseudonocardiales bacterium]